MVVSSYALLALISTAFGAFISPPRGKSEESSCGRVWLTVHSVDVQFINAGVVRDALELNWDFSGCDSRPTQIGLFDEKPTNWNNCLVNYEIGTDCGYVVTAFPLEATPLPGGWEADGGRPGPHCLGPWIGAGDDHIDAYNCLKIQPTWMEDNAEKINDLRIGELALPGTHNAGAWKFNTEISTADRDAFVLCQDRSIWEQLVHGIRYLDFRIAYYDFYINEEDRYWLNHNMIRIRQLVPLLREIRNFLDTTKEVVFLDAHHFPLGFYDQNGNPLMNVHAGLLELVQRELGPHIAPFHQFSTGAGTSGPALQTLVHADKRLVFSYIDNAIFSVTDWVWPPLPHLWANTNDPEQLLRYLDDTIDRSPLPNARSHLYSAMAQTTPTVLDILFLRGSLRQNANAVNRNVTEKLMTRWRKNANIVSTDFFLGNDVVDVSIMLNVERSSSLISKRIIEKLENRYVIDKGDSEAPAAASAAGSAGASDYKIKL